MYPYQTKNRHHTGTVTNESKVVNTTHFVAKASSFLYLEAITAVTLAAGIAAKTTDTPVTRSSTYASLQPIYTKRGTNTKRINA